MLNVALNGACGKMGRMISEALTRDPDTRLSAAIDSPRHPEAGREYAEKIPLLSAVPESGFDVLIDFSTAKACRETIEICAKQGIPVVVGTTGLSPDFLKMVRDDAARKIPVLISPNMSLGVNLIFRIAAQIAASLGKGYDLEIIEKHHRFKKDAPSGTALKIASEIAEKTGKKAEDTFVFGRRGEEAERRPGSIGIHAVRAGDIVGEHTVLYSTIGETIELTHRAHTRDNFAVGAVQAAKFVARATPGYYSMQDVLES